MKYVNIPTSVAPAASMTRSHAFSWASGQWYFRRRSRTRITVSLAIFSGRVDVEEGVEEDILRLGVFESGIVWPGLIVGGAVFEGALRGRWLTLRGSWCAGR